MQTIQSAAQAVAPMLQGYVSNDAPQQAPITSMPNPMLPQQMGSSNGYADVQDMPGLVEPGTPGLATVRPIVNFTKGLNATNATPAGIQQFSNQFQPNPNSYGSEFSTTEDDPKDPSKVVVLPTIFNGKLHSTQEAIEQYKKTGEHFGKFDKAAEESSTPKYKNSDAYSTKLHQRNIYVNGKLYTGPAN
jgi:hypothetical protein